MDEVHNNLQEVLEHSTSLLSVLLRYTLWCFTLSDFCLFIYVVCFCPSYCELIKGRDQVFFISIVSPVPGMEEVPGRACCLNA